MKRRLALIGIILLVITSPAFSAMSTEEHQLLQLEEQWTQAFETQDAATLKRILHPSFIATFADDPVMSKDEYIALTRATKSSVTVQSMTPHVIGNTGLVTGYEHMDMTYQGKQTVGDYRFTDVLIKRQGKWYVLATHEHRIEKTP